MPFKYQSSAQNITPMASPLYESPRRSNEPSVKTSIQTDKNTGKQQDKFAFQVSEPKFKLNDLIISTEAFDTLTTVINAQTCWNKIFVEWDLKSVMSDRRNLFVNLYGAPGTGKTMAAHAIAAALKKKILAVNYAEIESKYVGETS